MPHCPVPGPVYTGPMPVNADATQEFQAAIERLSEVSGGNALSYIADHGRRCIDDAVRLSRMRPGGKILNVGGRPYLFEYIARELEMDVDTLDLSPDRNPAEIADLGIDVRALDFEKPEDRAKIDLEAYDIICLAEIIEHMRHDLVGTFRDLSHRMRRDALAYVTTPNFYYAPAILKTLSSGRSGPSLVREWGKLEQVGHMGHVREYARSELRDFFRFTGFDIQSSVVRNSRFSPLRGGGLAQTPVRAFARFLSGRFDLFGQELIFILAPADSA